MKPYQRPLSLSYSSTPSSTLPCLPSHQPFPEILSITRPGPGHLSHPCPKHHPDLTPCPRFLLLSPQSPSLVSSFAISDVNTPLFLYPISPSPRLPPRFGDPPFLSLLHFCEPLVARPSSFVPTFNSQNPVPTSISLRSRSGFLPLIHLRPLRSSSSSNRPSAVPPVFRLGSFSDLGLRSPSPPVPTSQILGVPLILDCFRSQGLRMLGGRRTGPEGTPDSLPRNFLRGPSAPRVASALVGAQALGRSGRAARGLAFRGTQPGRPQAPGHLRTNGAMYLVGDPPETRVFWTEGTGVTITRGPCGAPVRHSLAPTDLDFRGSRVFRRRTVGDDRASSNGSEVWTRDTSSGRGGPPLTPQSLFPSPGSLVPGKNRRPLPKRSQCAPPRPAEKRHVGPKARSPRSDTCPLRPNNA